MRYVIGIDLGTTNTCVAYVDSEDPKLSVQSFKIPQLVSEGSIASLSTLPSYCYLVSGNEWAKGSLQLPWSSGGDYFVGNFAQGHGAKVPTRLVRSAKSWLCHTAANRRDRILPFESMDEQLRISPVEASARYLRHVRDAWNNVMARGDVDAEFNAQEIILTVPASFDEVARTLTVEAARLAGFEKMTLLEEPQAAFYSWIAQHEGDWMKHLPVGSCILVCDVGGGTTDFSLIEVALKDGKEVFQRMSVGDHLLLGGDNMDVGIAHRLESELNVRGHHLSSVQRLQLLHEVRKGKEVLMHVGSLEKQIEQYHILIQGAGSSVVQGSLKATLNRNDVQQYLLEGFFSQYGWDEALKLKKTAGIRAMGLPYEDEPSISKHLAHFLQESAIGDGILKKPDYVLFNGGSMKPALFQQAILSNLQRWFPEKHVNVLESVNLDLAVARGAAYYGKARRGFGVKIGGGVARGYYLVLDVKERDGSIVKKALTLLPRGSEDGAVFESEETFLLTANTPVSFQMCTSHVRLYDVSGALIDIDAEHMQFLPPIYTILSYGKRPKGDVTQEKIPVHLQIKLTSIGTLQIELKSLKTEHRWALEFQLRSVAGQDNSLTSLNKRERDQTFSVGALKGAESIVEKVFSPEKLLKSSQLMERLEEELQIDRREWSPSIMRGLADVGLKVAGGRKLSAEQSGRWWNFVGFVLRPGFGYPLDDFRIKELWKCILSDGKAIDNFEVKIQMWICYRRIAGGLNKGQQMQIANDLAGTILSKRGGLMEAKSKNETYAFSEKLRVLGAFELIDMSLKLKLGQALVSRIAIKEGCAADYWTLGRIGARHLLYGTMANVVSSEVCEQWVEKLLNSMESIGENDAFLMGQLARKTEYKELNLSNKIVDRILTKFIGTVYFERLQQLVTSENSLSESEADRAFGDHLPAGLLLEI